VATLPAAILAARISVRFGLLDAAWAIPVAAVLGSLALVLARRSHGQVRFRLDGDSRAARAGRALAVLALSLALAASISVGFYALLVSLQ
jgi:hypothetical protein